MFFMGTKDMPSLNWSRLRPIAHSIASTIRHAQASAYQFHRDLETIREENRRYAAAHYGTAPHWDGYGPDGRRTGNGSGSGNGNRSRSGSRSGSRNGNSDRQRQRDRSFERSHPWMSRALYYAMPHLGGYETGRGFTWNAQGERWGDSLVPVPDAPDALRSAVSKGWESDSQDMGTPINSFPSLSIRAAAPSVSSRDRAKSIRNGMRKWEEAEEETVWVTAHFRSGTFINLYPRSRPHRNGNGNGNGKK